MEQIGEDADEGTRGKYGREDREIILHILIDAEKHEHTHARIGDQTRQKRARGNHAVKEKLGDDNGGCAIRDQTDEGGNDGRKHTRVRREIGDSFLPNPMDTKPDDKGKKEDNFAGIKRTGFCKFGWSQRKIAGYFMRLSGYERMSGNGRI